NLGGTAISVVGGTGHRVVSCDVHDVGEAGISVEGGDRRTLTPARHEVLNNHVHHFAAWVFTYRPGIRLAGVGCRAAHNLIHHTPHMAVGISGNDHLFELNEIHSAVYETDDAGALYTGRNPSLRGNVIRHNYWHHIGSGLAHGQAAIYLDDGVCGTLVEGNVFYRAGGGSFGAVFVHGGKENLFQNNLFVECPIAAAFSPWSDERWRNFLKSELITERLYKEIDVRKPPYITRYPELARLPENSGVNTLRRNVALRCGRFLREKGGDVQQLSQNLELADLPALRFEGEGRPVLDPDLPVLREIGFEPIPFREIGLVRDALRPVWPVVHPPRPLPEGDGGAR
ncbi:MAG: right-handed parallel beta-helix repeat-containing protein, partial [Armatimonadota bacterium]|nr:right-handed parallel beta-helix repeat-containing protein [Armatimonadota bacterium]